MENSSNYSDQPQRVVLVWHRIVTWVLRRILILGLVVVGGLYLLSFSATVPDNIGVVDGKLAACPESPNCVCSQAADSGKRIPAIVLPKTDDGQAAIKRIKSVVAEHFSDATLVTEEENYLHYEFRSLVFRFVDDVEFLIDADQQQIDFRSASRVGHSDLGMNAKRMRKITSLLQRAEADFKSGL